MTEDRIRSDLRQAQWLLPDGDEAAASLVRPTNRASQSGQLKAAYPGQATGRVGPTNEANTH
jgi:hypothetical protein